MIPANLSYTTEHEWVEVTDSGAVRVGITHHAQDSLGDIVFVSLPNPGDDVAAGDGFGEIESTKSVAEIYAPLAGEVTKRNDVVETSPEVINTDPYGAGWLVEITPNESDLPEGLLNAAGYAAFIEGK